MDCKNIVKISILLKGIYRLNGISVKILTEFFTKMKKILKFTWNHNTLQIIKATVSIMSKVVTITTLDFITYYKVITTKTAE
jgi:hypothetical protein